MIGLLKLALRATRHLERILVRAHDRLVAARCWRQTRPPRGAR